jgi:3-dehydroquinate synthase
MKTHQNPWGDAVVGWGALRALGDWLRAEPAPRRIFFLVDENTHEACLPLVQPEVPDGCAVEVLEVPAGEGSKEPEMALSLWEALREHGAHRDDVLIAVGGGMVTDLGGFVAATYKRGMRYAAVPTSLLAMVDASVGGKSGVNLASLKNAVGTFYRAEGVFVDPVFLETLPPREVAAGWAEMIKHAYLDGGEHWNTIGQFAEADADTVERLIQLSVAFKARLVEEDPLDRLDVRAALNAGHTVGHALEALAWADVSEEPGDGVEAESLPMQDAAQEPLLHGEAVAAGLWMESWVAEGRGLQPTADAAALRSLIRAYYARVPLPSLEAAWTVMQHDKKNRTDEVRMALLQAPGNSVVLSAVTQAECAEAWEAYAKTFV